MTHPHAAVKKIGAVIGTVAARAVAHAARIENAVIAATTVEAATAVEAAAAVEAGIETAAAVGTENMIHVKNISAIVATAKTKRIKFRSHQLKQNPK
jgi:hypothetical protein